MLKEISIEELPESGRGSKFLSEQTPDGKFADETVKEFMASDIMIAEITGWPSGEAKSYKEACRYRGLVKGKIRKYKLEHVNVLLRGRKIFIRKLEN